MAKFVKHEPCPKCGSRDNLARYDDGSAYCFGCTYYDRGNIHSIFYGSIRNKVHSYRSLPGDCNPILSRVSLDFLGPYNLSIEEIIKYKFLWSESNKWLIFPFYGESNNLVGWQARQFNGKKPKYLHFMSKDHINLIKFNLDTGRVVLVEDYISAIKIGRQENAVAILGADASQDLLQRLSRYFKEVLVWLDSDKLKSAWKAVERAKNLGLKSRAIYTDLDPKYYNDEEIKAWLA